MTNPFDHRLSMYQDFTTRTPSGLVVTQDAYESMVKAEARRQRAEQDRKTPLLFSPYALYQNMQVYGAREKPNGTPRFEDLYLAAEKSFIDRIIIQARRDQSKLVWQKAVEGRVLGYKVVHDRHDDPKFKPTPKILEQCAEMEALLSDPTPVKFRDLYPHKIRIHDTLKDFITRMVSSELIIDRKVMYRYKRRDGKGYGAFHWLPGATVKPVHETIRDWQAKNDPKFKLNHRQVMDKMSIQYGVDFSSSSYIQVLDGIPIVGFTEDEIAIQISNPSDRENRNGYGESRLEISLDLTAAVMYAWRYNQELFKTNYPEAILTVSGDFDKAGLEAFKHQLIGEAGGVAQAWRLPVISTTPGADMANFKVESHKLRDSPKDMLFDQMLRMIFNLKCFKYDTMVETLEHGDMWIGKIAVNKMPVHVKSFDRITGEVSWKKCVDWQVLKATDWVKIYYAGGDRKQRIDVTVDHDLWNGREMVQAGTLKEGDTLYVKAPAISCEQEQVILGSLLGDGSIKKIGIGKQRYGSPSLSESHSESQRDYAMWKMAAYENLDPTCRDSFVTAKGRGTQKYHCVSFLTKASPALERYRNLCMDAPDGKKRVTWEWLSKIGVLGLAVWFMDDGAFGKQKQQLRYTSNITLMPSTPEELSLYFRYFVEKWGLYPRITPTKGKRCFRLRFSADDTEKLREILSPYLTLADPLSKHASVRKEWHAEPITIGSGEVLAPVKINKIQFYTVPKGQPCYDVTVDDTHTLFANNLASSNCAAFGTHPSTINFGMESGGGTSSPLSSHDPSSEINFAKEQGFKPHLLDMAAWFTDALIKPTYPDLRLIIEGLEAENEKEQLEIRTEKGRSYVTTNELRAMDGLEPIGFWCAPDKYAGLPDEDKKQFDENPWNWPSDAPKTSYIQTFNSAKQQEQMMQMQQGGGDEQGQGDDQDGQQDNPWGEGYDDSQDQSQNPWGDNGEEQQGGNQQNQGMQKSQRDVKYLKITID